MNKKLIIVLALLTVLSFGCTLLSKTTVSGETGGSTPAAASEGVPLTPLPGAQVEGISAQATGAVSVSINWEPIPEATKYLLEINLGGEFVPMAILPATQTAYQDENAPPSTRLTYRLSRLENGLKQASKEISVDTPAEVARPLQVRFEPDKAPAALSLDPNNLDPGSLDPNNLDPSMFMPQPVEAEAILGPQGGEIKVTGTNGVIYTLVVAPGALRTETPIKLKPIATVTDLPLSGGALATVLIEPDSLVFDIPAQLKMTPPGGFAAAGSAAPLRLAYAFDEQGQEFHLYPFSPAAGQSRLAREVAGVGFIPSLLPPLSDIAPLQSGGAYGIGNGSISDVKKIIQNPASKLRNRSEQRAATNQIDELTPLTPIEDDLTPLPSKASLEFGKTGEAIRQKAAQAGDWGKFIEAVDDFSAYINAGADKFNPALNDKILDLLATKAQALLQKNKGECLTYNDFVAQELVERLSNPKDRVSKALADRFIAKFGQKLLDDLTYGKKNCAFELSLDSKLTFTAEGSKLTTLAKAPSMKLSLVYSKGEVFLWGAGKLDLQDQVSGMCNFPLKHYDSLIFVVEKLVPVFENGVLVDFNLHRYSVSGWKKGASIRATEGEKCPVLVNLQGAGDYWTGLFTLSRMDDPIYEWQIHNNLAQGSSLTADWVSLRPSFAPLGTSGGTMTEDTKFHLKVTKTKP